MMHKSARTDTSSPPGQISPARQVKTLDKEIEEFKARMSGYSKQEDGCCHKTVLERCSDCSFNKTLDKK